MFKAPEKPNNLLFTKNRDEDSVWDEKNELSWVVYSKNSIKYVYILDAQSQHFTTAWPKNPFYCWCIKEDNKAVLLNCRISFYYISLLHCMFQSPTFTFTHSHTFLLDQYRLIDVAFCVRVRGIFFFSWNNRLAMQPFNFKMMHVLFLYAVSKGLHRIHKLYIF